jgi:spore coat protein H
MSCSITTPVLATNDKVQVASKTAGRSSAASPIPSPFVPDASDLVDPSSHYNVPLTLLNIRLKALPVDASNPYTIADVNTDIDPYDSFVPEIKVHFQADDYPDDGKTDNAKLRIRGSSSRLGAQKSYRVKLNSGIAAWRGETTLQLNKHPWDLTRIRNKLAFELFSEIPHLNSLRTQFVHMTFDDDANPATPDVDYGLFTHVEKMGKEYLANRGWPASSTMYKAAEFYFRSDPRLALKADNSPVNTSDFERVLEIDNGTNHSVLLQMISAIDSDSTDFNAEFAKYFNRNNYLTWLAVNMLMGNRDTRDQNFALLQPAGTSRFYLLPWDYDGALGFESQPDIAAAATLYADWQLGISNYWESPLHRRFLQQPGNLAALESAVEELRSQYLTSSNIQQKIDSYRPLIESLVTRDPDLANLPTVSQDVAGRQQEWSGEYQRLSTVITDNYNGFRQRLEKPMPFWQAAENNAGKLVLTWDKSVDLQNDAVSYEVGIARQPDFAASSVIVRQSGVADTRLETTMLPNGTYYMRVLATDSKGYTQEAFDRTDEGGHAYFGVRKFTLADKFTVTPPTGSGYTITPSTPVIVDNLTATSFTVMPATGYGIASVSGCGGSYSGSTYTTGSITADCTISVAAAARSGTSGGASQPPTLSDAFKVLMAVAGTAPLTAAEQISYDVAPLAADGNPLGNGVIDAADAILILRRSIGIGNW